MQYPFSPVFKWPEDSHERQCDKARRFGLEQITSWGAAIYQFNKNWFGAAMIYYQRLTGSAAESPIVTQRGTRNQITYGVGVAYAFR